MTDYIDVLFVFFFLAGTIFGLAIGRVKLNRAASYGFRRGWAECRKMHVLAQDDAALELEQLWRLDLK